MKKLSKIVALLLAGAMAMVMFTACTGGGNTGSNLKEDKDAEAKVLSKYSTSVANNKELKDEAEKFLDEKLTVSGGIGGYRFVLDGKVKGKDKEYLTVLVAANFSYNDTLLGVILDEISKKVKTLVLAKGGLIGLPHGVLGHGAGLLILAVQAGIIKIALAGAGRAVGRLFGPFRR